MLVKGVGNDFVIGGVNETTNAGYEFGTDVEPECLFHTYNLTH
jgi:hypothetical protein